MINPGPWALVTFKDISNHMWPVAARGHSTDRKHGLHRETSGGHRCSGSVGQGGGSECVHWGPTQELDHWGHIQRLQGVSPCDGGPSLKSKGKQQEGQELRPLSTGGLYPLRTTLVLLLDPSTDGYANPTMEGNLI